MRSLGGFFLVLCLALPAVAQTAGTLRIAVPSLPTVFDPHKAASPLDIAVSNELYMGLVTRGADGELVPGIASSWDISADGLAYTFSLRSDAKWSDGRRVTAGDFVAGFERALDPRTAAPYAGDLLMIEGAEDVLAGRRAPRNLNVSSSFFGKLRLNLARPSANFLEILARPIAAPVPRHVLGGETALWEVPESAVTSGAYMVTNTGTGLSLVRNPHFFERHSSEIERIDFVLAESADVANGFVENGLANLTLGFSFVMRSSSESRFLRADGGRALYFVAVNVRRPVLAVREVRHALAMSLDRESLLRKIEVSGAVAAYKIISPDILDEVLSPPASYARLPAEMRGPIAEVRLAESQIGPSAPYMIRLIYPLGEVHDSIARHITTVWAPLGIQVVATGLPQSEYDQALFTGEFDAALASGRRGGTSPMTYMMPLTQSAGSLNITGYDEPDFDMRLIAADTEPDGASRQTRFAEAENVLIQDQVILPVFFYTPRHAVADIVQGWIANTHGVHPLRYLSSR